MLFLLVVFQQIFCFKGLFADLTGVVEEALEVQAFNVDHHDLNISMAHNLSTQGKTFVEILNLFTFGIFLKFS